MPASFRQAHGAQRTRWALYLALGAAAAATVGPWLVLVLLVCGIFETALRRRATLVNRLPAFLPLPIATSVLPAVGTGVFGTLAWVAFKVGALGFVIVPLMQADAVNHYHWMSGEQFLTAVALGQVTPGPVTHTVAVVGYAAAGLFGAVLAAAIAFAPSFAFVLLGARHFDRLRGNPTARAFLGGAGPGAIGAILGSAVPLASELHEGWQFAVLAAAAVTLLVLRRGVVLTLVAAGAIGVVLALAGAPVPG
jgi:chromate transporter